MIRDKVSGVRFRVSGEGRVLDGINRMDRMKDERDGEGFGRG
jgi:hypothetical protein